MTPRRSVDLFLAALLWRGNLCAFLARFREADGDRLLAILDGIAALAALQLAALVLAHGAPDTLLGFLAVLSGHHCLLVKDPYRKSPSPTECQQGDYSNIVPTSARN